MSFPSGPPFPKGATHSACPTTAKQALTSITKRVTCDARLPDRVTTKTSSPDYSPNSVLVEHYPSQNASISDQSSATTITLVGSEEMAIASKKTGNVPSPRPDEKRSWRFYAAFGCLCIISLVCALDATSLSVALPVGLEACVKSNSPFSK